MNLQKHLSCGISTCCRSMAGWPCAGKCACVSALQVHYSIAIIAVLHGLECGTSLALWKQMAKSLFFSSA
jgi:hypothetical protein